MISFIIIGKNESKHIENCINSIYTSIVFVNLKDYEIIYVDSNSSDNTIDLVKKHPEISIYNIYKGQSPASGRNLGAAHSKHELLFFVDGDNAINHLFLEEAIDAYKNKKGDFFTAPHYNSYFNEHTGKTIIHKYDLSHSAFKTATGWFMIEREAFNKIGGFDETFKKPGGEDYDLTLRLKKRNTKICYLKNHISTHYTVLYHHPSRLWAMVFNRTQLYARSLLYRKHFFDKHMWPIIIGREYTMICLIGCLILAIITSNYYLTLGYFPAAILKSAIQKNRPFWEIFIRIPYYLLRDITTFLGFFFFWPRKQKEIKHERIL